MITPADPASTSPAPEHPDGGSSGRVRDPERSRERILDAALTEFAEHGFAGARVEAIARRSGLNKQLISHHFGGKRGLYDAVMRERRLRGGGELRSVPTRAAETLPAFFDRARNDPEWVRVLLWEALDERDDDGVSAIAERRARYDDRIEWVEGEQRAGRLPADLDADLLLLTLLGAALYPVLLPDVCEIMTGRRPDDPELAQRYRAHLARVADHLAP
jgi:AcrR family transcriptional regulator